MVHVHHKCISTTANILTLNASIYLDNIMMTLYFHTITELEYGISISMERFKSYIIIL